MCRVLSQIQARVLVLAFAISILAAFSGMPKVPDTSKRPGSPAKSSGIACKPESC